MFSRWDKAFWWVENIIGPKSAVVWINKINWNSANTPQFDCLLAAAKVVLGLCKLWVI